MILGQLRMGARQAKNAPLNGEESIWPSLDNFVILFTGEMFLFFLTNLEGDRCMLYSVFCIIYYVFHSAFCILYGGGLVQLHFPPNPPPAVLLRCPPLSLYPHQHWPKTSFLEDFVENIEIKEQTNCKINKPRNWSK